VGRWGCLGDDDGGGNVVFCLQLVAREEVLPRVSTVTQVDRGSTFASRLPLSTFMLEGSALEQVLPRVSGFVSVQIV
jgi:hypothetical protein